MPLTISGYKETLMAAGLTNSCEEKQKAKEKRKDKHLNAEFQRIARRDKKASSVINAKK